jgi:hypothetical protein
MRKIDKTEILATAYKTWESNIKSGEPHPKYNSSGGRFYYDIIANLVWVQKGLCAYTEYQMQGYGHVSPENWTDNKYPQFDFAGELDHYDPDLKTEQGWLWDNFFLIDADINSKKVKGAIKPNGLLKPDKADFDPSFYIEYDVNTHLFCPNRNRTAAEQLDIKHDIETLGLNWDPIKTRRESYLNKKIRAVKYGQQTYSETFTELYQFFTAFELSRPYMEN